MASRCPWGRVHQYLRWPVQVTKTLAEQKAAVLASAALKKAQRRQARQQEEADNLEILRHSRQAEDALAAAAAESQVHHGYMTMASCLVWSGEIKFQRLPRMI